MKIGDLLDLDRRVENLEAELEGPKEDLKSAIESGCDALMIRKDAFKSARKLRKLKPGELREWLRTFDACRDAFGFDNQIDIEDVLDNGEDTDVTISSEGVEVKTTGKGLRRAARLAREGKFPTATH